MRIAVQRALLALLLLAVAGCSAGPPFASVEATLPPVPQGAARIFVYRLLEPYEAIAPATLYLNNQPVGVTDSGSVLYRDVAPGRYTIAVESAGIYPNQFKTVTVGPGQIVYAHIESLESWSICPMHLTGCYDTLVVSVTDPATAQAEMRTLSLIRG